MFAYAVIFQFCDSFPCLNLEHFQNRWRNRGKMTKNQIPDKQLVSGHILNENELNRDKAGHDCDNILDGDGRVIYFSSLASAVTDYINPRW
jgi:hypothetical protein